MSLGETDLCKCDLTKGGLSHSHVFCIFSSSWALYMVSRLKNDGGLISTSILSILSPRNAEWLLRESHFLFPDNQKLICMETLQVCKTDCMNRRSKRRWQVFKSSTCLKLTKTLVKVYFQYFISLLKSNPTNTEEMPAILVFCHCITN